MNNHVSSDRFQIEDDRVISSSMMGPMHGMPRTSFWSKSAVMRSSLNKKLTMESSARVSLKKKRRKRRKKEIRRRRRRRQITVKKAKANCEVKCVAAKLG